MARQSERNASLHRCMVTRVIIANLVGWADLQFAHTAPVNTAPFVQCKPFSDCINKTEVFPLPRKFSSRLQLELVNTAPFLETFWELQETQTGVSLSSPEILVATAACWTDLELTYTTLHSIKDTAPLHACSTIFDPQQTSFPRNSNRSGRSRLRSVVIIHRERSKAIVKNGCT